MCQEDVLTVHMRLEQIFATVDASHSTESRGIASSLPTCARACTWISTKRHGTRADRKSRALPSKRGQLTTSAVGDVRRRCYSSDAYQVARRRHGHEIQVKGVNGIASGCVMAAAYAPMAERLAVGSLPAYLVVSYDVLRGTVVLAGSSTAMRSMLHTCEQERRLGRRRGEPDGSAPRSILPDSSGESWLDHHSSWNGML